MVVTITNPPSHIVFISSLRKEPESSMATRQDSCFAPTALDHNPGQKKLKPVNAEGVVG
jgi:hypothetical protein